MHIGLIVGIGPSATISYYERLVREFRKAKLPLELTIAHADVGDLITNSASDDRKAQAEIFEKHIQQLMGAGCDVATITAITGHFCFAETKYCLRQCRILIFSAIRYQRPAIRAILFAKATVTSILGLRADI